jgi:hypothetical protein
MADQSVSEFSQALSRAIKRDRWLVCWTCGTQYRPCLALIWRRTPLRAGERCRDTSWSRGETRCRGRLVRLSDVTPTRREP